MTDVAVYDHVRPVDDETADGDVVEPGVYRVVGTGAETVTLLRVGDAGGRRITTGEVQSIDRESLSGFEPTANPDGNRPVSAAVASRLEGVAWEFVVLAQAVRSRPLVGLAVVALLVVGIFGEGVVPVPERGLDAAVLVGALGLVYLAYRGGD